VAFAPDDAWLVSVAEDGSMVKWSAATGKIIQTLDGCFSSFRGVCVSPDGDWIATFDEEGTIKLWSATEEWNAQ
jgi:WD40 repeat protein